MSEQVIDQQKKSEITCHIDVVGHDWSEGSKISDLIT
jgi:hypothetical protein